MSDRTKVFVGGMVAGSVTLISLMTLWGAVENMVWAIHFISQVQ